MVGSAWWGVNGGDQYRCSLLMAFEYLCYVMRDDVCHASGTGFRVQYKIQQKISK